MTPDPARIQAKLQVIRENIRALREIGGRNEAAFLSEFTLHASARYGLQTAIEAAIDVANHIVAREALGTPERHADLLRLLVNHGVLDRSKQDDFVAMVGLRNAIVHAYDKIDNHRIYRVLQENLGDLDAFCEQVLAYLDRA